MSKTTEEMGTAPWPATPPAPGPAETWNYRYDHRNQLIAAEQHASDGGTLLAKVQYKYDALGDRIERDEDAEM